MNKKLIYVDIGASDGLTNPWNSFKEDIKVIGFEPDKGAFDLLVNQKQFNDWKFFNIGLFSSKTTIEFNIARKQQVSSIFKPNFVFLNRFNEPERFLVDKIISVPVDTLDNLSKNESIENIDFIKIDTQGSELEILKGAQRVLSNEVLGIEVEVEFQPLYENQPLFSEIDSYLRSLGFILLDLNNQVYWNKKGVGKGQLIFSDALYIKDPSSFNLFLNQSVDINLSKHKLIGMIKIATLYNHLDLAYQILNDNDEILSKTEIEFLIDYIDNKVPKQPKKQSFKTRLFNKLRRIIRWANY